jgi:hypothetical protein
MGKNNDLGAKLAVAIIAPLAVKFAVERFAESEK